jgi:general stress protein 26
MPNAHQSGPRVELDPRYSDAGAAPTSWEAAARRLSDAEVAWIVTVRPDGRPHATPMVPVVGPDAAYFHTGTREVKYANLQADPRVLVLAGDTAWESGLDVVLDGVATPVTDRALLEEVARLYRARWDGRWQLDVRGGAFVNDSEGGVGSVLFEVRPDRAYAYAKGGPFSQTRYLF